MNGLSGTQENQPATNEVKIMKKSTVAIICVIIAVFAVTVALSSHFSGATLLNGLGRKTTAELTIGNYTNYRTTELQEILSIVNHEDSEQSEFTNSYSYSAKSFEPSQTYVKPIGRTVYNNGQRWFSMSGSGVEFNCKAEAVELTLLSENNSYISYNHKPRVAVFVEDCLVFDQSLEKDETTVRIDLSQFGGNAAISVVKLSESMHSCCGIGNITIYGNKDIKPTEDKPLKLEFLGDSITCGYGIDEPNRNAGFSTRTENFAKSYAYLTSKMLGADYSAIAFSGYGVVSGYTTNGRRNENATIFKYYDKAITNKKQSEDFPTDEWNSLSYAPDIVVINLGTNDASYCKTSERRAEFVSEYKRLISLVREKNQNAYILCILGDMNNSLYPSIETAVNEYQSETYDQKISCTKINFKMGENPIVIAGHPGAESNYLAAQDLANTIINLRYAGKI